MPLPGTRFIEVMVRETPGGLKAHFHGVQQCNCAHGCLKCRARLKTARAREITKAIKGWAQQHGRQCVAMMTLTVAHSWGDELGRLLDGEAAAWRSLQQRQAFRRWLRELGVAGFIRANEQTHGKPNGWHPHFHILFLSTKPLLPQCRWRDGRWRCPRCGQDHGRASTKDNRYGPLCNNCPKSEFRQYMIDAWRATVQRCASLGSRAIPSHQHAVDLISANRAAQYIQKLGLELSAPNTKHAEGDRRTPEQIARDIAYAPTGTLEMVADLELYVGYIEAMKGRKLLFWSRGLKKLTGVLDQTDEEILAKAQAKGTPVARIYAKDFYLIAWNPGWRQDLLEAALVGDAVGFKRLLHEFLHLERERRKRWVARAGAEAA
jgi:hypothetical protein